MNLIKKIGYIFSHRQKVRLFILFVIILIGTGLELLGVTAILPFVNVITNSETIFKTTYLHELYTMLPITDTNQFIVILAIALIAIYVIKNIYLVFMYGLQYRFTYNNQRKMAYTLMNCYMNQTYLYHLDHNSAELIRNVWNDTGMFFQAVLACLQLATEASVCFVLFIYLLIIDKTITIGVAILLVGFVLIFVKVYKKRLRCLGEQSRKNNANITQWLQQAFGGIKESKILGRESYFVDCFNKEYIDYAEAQRKYQLLGALPRPIMEAACVCGLLIVVAVKISRGVNTEYFVPTLSVFAVAAFRLLPSFNRMTGYINTIMFYRPSVDAIYSDLCEVSELQERNKNDYHEDRTIVLDHDGIKIKDLYFKYPSTNKYVLSNINLVIPKNEAVAFTGPSGSGKTTLADIILGVLEPEKGEVLVNEINVHDHLASWRKKLGYIPQSIYLMDDTLRNNIAFGIQLCDIDEDRIWEALEDAQLKHFVEELDNGLDTIIGERGIRLSGGQRQRIGIARALYNNPEVLVLDEATSALDNDTETAVMEAINQLAGKKTLIIIAHRLSTIQNCSLVYEIREGSVKLKK